MEAQQGIGAKDWSKTFRITDEKNSNNIASNTLILETEVIHLVFYMLTGQSDTCRKNQREVGEKPGPLESPGCGRPWQRT